MRLALLENISRWLSKVIGYTDDHHESHSLYCLYPCPAERIYAQPSSQEKERCNTTNQLKRYYCTVNSGEGARESSFKAYKKNIEKDQSNFQRCFTSHSSAINAALIMSDAQNEPKDMHTPLRMVTLDACKAFDVVWQDSLLRKMINVGVQGKLWLTIRDMYSYARSVVKWNG